MATHCVCAVFPAAIGMLYRYVSTTVFMDNITSNSLSVDKRYYPSIANVAFTFSAIHCCMLAMYIVRSIQCRKLVFRQPVVSAGLHPPDPNKGYPGLVQAVLLRLSIGKLVVQTEQAIIDPVLLALDQRGTHETLLCDRERAPGHRVFNMHTTTYDVRYGYMDVWLIQMINELQILLVQTLYDGLSKFWVALSAGRWLYAITKIICPAESLARTRASIVPDPIDTKAAATPDSAPPSPIKSKFRSGTLSNMLPRISARKHQIEKVGHRFLVLWGLFVLIAHLHTASHPMHPQCRLCTRPWFTTKPGCSLLEINCKEEETVGAASDIERTIQTVEASHIEHLVFRHCAALEIPTRVSTLSHLMGLKIYNSSISKWSDDAAVTSSSHPLLRFMFFIDMNATEFSPGLLSPAFPQKLSQVVISKSNITEIPDTLDAIWLKRLILVLEEMPLREFPHVVLRMLPLYLSLALDELTAIPAALFDTNFISLLVLNGNPLQSLPHIHPQFGWLSLVSTTIDYLPDWITDKSYVLGGFITAADTPLCDRMIASGEAATALAVTPTGISGIDCSRTIVAPGPVNWYPINFEEVRNPSYSLT